MERLDEFREKERKAEHVRDMRRMLQTDAELESFRITGQFATEFFAGKAGVSDEALSLKAHDDIHDYNTNLKSLIADLCSQFVRYTDSLNELVKEYERTGDIVWYSLFMTRWRERREIVVNLFTAYGTAKMRNWIIQVESTSELQQLRQDKATLEKENEQLKNEVKKLRSDYKTLKVKHDILDQMNAGKFRSDVQGGDKKE